ncbi:PEPxxWA-CTERM sorting domain-containing protein [Sphingomonas sp. MAH-20]|uniref:PEPxxWA-CTERM sorting domain-containing protein n=1 Tax=Sphingomonas horti TaxID=2682842 RepID=A0A6I4J3C8_9SPHN|nr:PEPxxWA-CTERM sorting domain-containing protein [Sphingomonas sp. CGMCC 1.13658]MVO78754.1 PEPxxWA-CTERM sorting domain-containing protein [Sphingomonas horti]
MLFCGIAAATLAASGASAATINLIDLGGVTGSPAEQGFKIAAGYWASVLSNNATINLGVRFAPLAPNVIGSTGSTRSDTTVAAWKNGVIATRSGYTLDQTAVLPTLNADGGASFVTNGARPDGNNDTAIQFYNDGATTSSKVLYLNTSVQKAVGIYTGPSNQRDGNVTFSTNFNFDFNPLDGIQSGHMDFIGVAIHEIGHALGFVSGVDLLDAYGYPSGPGAGTLGYDLNDTSIFSALDMFRFSNDPNNVAPGSGPTRDLSVGTASYFSIDGGLTQVNGNALFSTGAYNGDGRQASHFKDTPSNKGGCSGYNQLGILDPTFCYGEMGVVKGLDLAAYDAMGWNLNFDVLNNLGYQRTTAQIYAQALGVPEPTSWALMIAGFGLLGGAMRRRARTTAVTYA